MDDKINDYLGLSLIQLPCKIINRRYYDLLNILIIRKIINDYLELTLIQLPCKKKSYINEKNHVERYDKWL